MLHCPHTTHAICLRLLLCTLSKDHRGTDLNMVATRETEPPIVRLIFDNLDILVCQRSASNQGIKELLWLYT